MKTPLLVIGVGNRHRGDDGVGPYVADLIRAASEGAVETATVDADLSALASIVDPSRIVVVVDAMAGGRAPGTIEVVDGLGDDLTIDDAPVSSHGVGLVEAIGLARILGRAPRELTVYLVEGRDFGHLEPLSVEVEAAGLEVARRLLTELRCRLDGPDVAEVRSRARSGGS